MVDKYLPPTDSLYKFVAISGLLLFCLSFVPRYLDFQISIQIIELNNELKTFSVKQDEINYKYENWKKKIDDIEQNSDNQQQELKNEINENLERINKGDYSSIKKLVEMSQEIKDKKNQYFKANNSELINETKKLHDDFNEISIGKIQLNTKVELIKNYQDQIYSLNILSWVILLIGVLFMMGGFICWYKKIQVPNDLILKKKAETITQSEQSEE